MEFVLKEQNQINFKLNQRKNKQTKKSFSFLITYYLNWTNNDPVGRSSSSSKSLKKKTLQNKKKNES